MIVLLAVMYVCLYVCMFVCTYVCIVVHFVLIRNLSHLQILKINNAPVASLTFDKIVQRLKTGDWVNV